MCCSVSHCVTVCYSVLQCVAVCCSALQCVAVRCSVLHCVAVCCSAGLVLEKVFLFGEFWFQQAARKGQKNRKGAPLKNTTPNGWFVSIFVLFLPRLQPETCPQETPPGVSCYKKRTPVEKHHPLGGVFDTMGWLPLVGALK